jgi:hypothetical protein
MTAPIMDVSAVIEEAVSAALPAPQPDSADVAPKAEPSVAETATDDEAEADVADASAETPGAEVDAEAPAADEVPDMPEGYVAVPTVSEGLATEK